MGFGIRVRCGVSEAEPDAPEQLPAEQADPVSVVLSSEQLEEFALSSMEGDYWQAVARAGTVAIGGSATGEIEAEDDHDWFTVTLEADKTCRIDVKGNMMGDVGGPLHSPALAMYDPSGNAIRYAADDNRGVGLNARLAAFAPDSAGKHFIEVEDPGGLGACSVAVEEVADSM